MTIHWDTILSFWEAILNVAVAILLPIGTTFLLLWAAWWFAVGRHED